MLRVEFVWVLLSEAHPVGSLFCSDFRNSSKASAWVGFS
jgi:hypothetical protein